VNQNDFTLAGCQAHRFRLGNRQKTHRHVW